MGRGEGESLFRCTPPLRAAIRSAEGTAVIVDRVASGKWVPVREKGHVALGLGQVIMQRSVAAGCNGATGKGAKNPLVVGLLNDRLFSPARVRGGSEEERTDLNQVKMDGLRLRAATKQRRRQKASALSFVLVSLLFTSKCCDCCSHY